MPISLVPLIEVRQLRGMPLLVCPVDSTGQITKLPQGKNMKPVDTTVVVKDGRGTDSNPDPITGQPGRIRFGQVWEPHSRAARPRGGRFGRRSSGRRGWPRLAVWPAAWPARASPRRSIPLSKTGTGGKLRPPPVLRRKYSYDEYQPAYRYGWEARATNWHWSFDEAEARAAAAQLGLCQGSLDAKLGKGQAATRTPGIEFGGPTG